MRSILISFISTILASFRTRLALQTEILALRHQIVVFGIVVSPATVAKYRVRNPKPLYQTWRAFLKNHTTQLASIDCFTVPTITFRILYVFLVLSHERRRVVHCNITSHPTAEWTS